MPGRAGKRSSAREGAVTTGCVLLLVLVADVAAALLVAILLAARGLGRMDAGSGRTATGVPPVDWTPVVGFGALALTVGVTALVLLRIGDRVVGAVQLTLCGLLALHALGSWP
ncbi:inner-membrane translocator [[Kitasatospora] papulosa]|uniref:inner-membrane translocator n=1 Tax=[Kitasatospora] papulosa TaxID=1464011 RepID=UPI0035D605FC